MSVIKRHWRAILFFTFAFGFLISAPLVVLYTAGYRYQFGSTHLFKTGVLSITSIPKGASVIIDNVLASKKTPAVIDNLFPGQSKIRVEKNGYSSWEKTLPIQSGNSTFASNIVLFLITSPKALLNKPMILEVVRGHDSSIVYLVKQAESLEVWVYDTASASNHLLTRVEANPKSIFHATWSPDDQYILLEESRVTKKYTQIRVRDASIVTLPFKTTSNAWWDVGSSHTLFYQQDTELKNISPEVIEPVPKKLIAQSAIRKNNQLIVIQSKEQSIVSSVDQAGVSSIIAYLPMGSYRFVSAPHHYLLLEETKQHRLVLLDPTQNNSVLLDQDAVLWQWNKDGDQLLFSNTFEIKLFSFATGDVQTITRFSEPITALAWHSLADVIIYNQNGVVKALELDDRDKRHETILANDLNIESLWVSNDASKLFLIGRKADRSFELYERQLQK